MRPLLGIAAVIVVVVAIGAVLFLSGQDEETYRVRAIFDNAGFIIPGEDVKIAGVKVGKVSSLDVTEDFKAVIVLEITEPGYQDFRRDASCIVRPQNLIGERFVECKPTQVRSANSEPPPELAVIEDGPGEGERLLPVENTSQTVDIDLIGNTMRAPERERLSLILNEFGTAVAGRGRDLNEVIRRANPALRETDKVLEILANQNTVLEQLAVNSDTVLQPLARDRARVSGAIRNSSDVARATAERRDDLAADIRTLPEFLDELEPTMVRLGSLADETTPLLRDLGANAEAINNLVERQGPFAQAAIPAVDSLGEAAKVGTPAMTDARPVIADLRTLAKNVRPVGQDLREVLESFRDTQGIERLMDYIFYQVAAVNGFDAVGHYLRAGLMVNQCATYAIEPVPGCSANFPASSGSTSSLKANSGTLSEDPVLKATAAALARALGQQVEAVKNKKVSKQKSKKAKRRNPARREATPTPTPAGAAATPAPAAPQAAAPVAPAPTAPPVTSAPEATPTPTPSADPSGALLDYLFGGDE